ncbi:hypothetical protein LTR62_005568 [Meristemomyces frigidus]|uniref:AP-3 complex subunit delta n=1 Tax=Meristemomyces frigidus TaxID=1508187 RepID=A0AAN7TDG8_9PEZI|nr:hypothetical protein LTR62_005568 [Meristemomyces frigidus]
MFEKDIYQLIRGLRAHKGNEREYIQKALQECRTEVRGQDMDQKATALLKLIYLEMFGHDMSWASFNVLEVMSSAKYVQKRVGYLAAVQSFRPDTEVLMLAENMLKKDLGSPDKGTIALVLTTIPHVINPAMANSLLADLLPRMSHSVPGIRKKAIVTLYRLALVYPETLRPAWPKIKDRLLDEDEDPSVTAAIINVVCELGWRRPQDFLPLAPRLFELLTAGGNNWMAIKIIKLFSTLTPLEPRLVKKLLPPLTTIIKTTPAMSLLYECINGIVQGGIMEAAEGTTDGDEVARLCVNKLRAMLVVEGDPNLRYVALLAFAKITATHGDMVSQHSDVILECIDDPDISIRSRALELVVGMINANNLQSVVERLLQQLRTAGKTSYAADITNDRGMHDGIEPLADEDDEEMQTTTRAKQEKSAQAPPLPDDYRASVIERILEMCSRDTYSRMNDFEWYIGVLTELVKQCPAASPHGGFGALGVSVVANRVGDELLNVAVRVKAVRPEAAIAAQSLLLLDQRDQLLSGGQGVLSAASFIAGEYAAMLPNPDAVLTSLVHTSSAMLPAPTLASYIQAIPKLFTVLVSQQHGAWTSVQQSNATLLAARVVHFLEPLVYHANLEVQERAVEYLDLMRLASEAASSQQTSDDGGNADPPLLLTQVLPSLFSGMELNPVASTALRNVPQPADLDLDTPMNDNLHMLLNQAEYDTDFDEEADEVYKFYYEKPTAIAIDHQQRPAAARLGDPEDSSRSSSYQQDKESEPTDRDAMLRKKAERKERYRDDPYYIDPDKGSGSSTPMHNILRNVNGSDLDVDAIPVMELKLDNMPTESRQPAPTKRGPSAKKPRQRFEIAVDETLGAAETPTSLSTTPSNSTISRSKKSLLLLDSSALSALSLSDENGSRNSGATGALDLERRQAEEEEMSKAIKEVERLRLEMQRAQERIVVSREGDGEGMVVKARRKKKKKKKEGRVELGGGEGVEDAGGEGAVKRQKKKVKRKEGEELTVEQGFGTEGDEAAPVKTKTKRAKKRQVTFDEGPAE